MSELVEFKCPKCGAILLISVKGIATTKSKTIDDVKILFPQDLEEMLTFEEAKDFIVVKPRRFLGSENFAKIAAIVRDAGGEYVSAGKESRFKVPKKQG